MTRHNLRILRNRYLWDSIRQVLNLIDSCRGVKAMFIDAEKAFDRIEWGFQKYLLRKVALGPVFQQWIELKLYMHIVHLKWLIYKEEYTRVAHCPLCISV